MSWIGAPTGNEPESAFHNKFQKLLLLLLQTRNPAVVMPPAFAFFSDLCNNINSTSEAPMGERFIFRKLAVGKIFYPSVGCPFGFPLKFSCFSSHFSFPLFPANSTIDVQAAQSWQIQSGPQMQSIECCPECHTGLEDKVWSLLGAGNLIHSTCKKSVSNFYHAQSDPCCVRSPLCTIAFIGVPITLTNAVFAKAIIYGKSYRNKA